MKQRIQSDLVVTPEMQRLLDEARKREVTEDEWREQRISFAYGNSLNNPRITKESVRRAASHPRLQD